MGLDARLAYYEAQNAAKDTERRRVEENIRRKSIEIAIFGVDYAEQMEPIDIVSFCLFSSAVKIMILFSRGGWFKTIFFQEHRQAQEKRQQMDKPDFESVIVNQTKKVFHYFS